MASGLVLTIPASFGNKTVEVDEKRFSIGRTPENDLEIDDPSLSRRHAVIEDVDGRFMLTDCGSSNGTFVNGRQVLAPTELFDWDVLTFGGVSDVLVRLRENSRQREQISQRTTQGSPTQVESNRPYARPYTLGTAYSVVSKPILAIVAVVVILIITGVLLIINQRSNSRRSSDVVLKRQQNTAGSNNDTTLPIGDDASDTIRPTNPPDGGNETDTESTQLLMIESLASKVLTGISRDTRPVLTEKPLAQINATVQRYRGSSSLQEQLRAMRRALPQVSAIAQRNGVRVPLTVYATLARLEKDGRGDPAQVAAALSPTLSRMRGIFGDELAADSLLCVAALEEGPSLQWKINRLAGRVSDSPLTIRSIWYLHEHHVISDQTHNFVLRFLAIGVISQDPQKFGIISEPLIF